MLNHEKIDIKNRNIFKKKKILQIIYNNYFNLIKKQIFENKKYPIIEIGSIGFIKKILPNCITSNLVKNNSMIDKKQNIYSLIKSKKKYSNIILIDVFHHLRFPKIALKNMHKVLSSKGRVIMIEPAMGLIPRFLYALFHHEPNGFEFKINWSKYIDREVQKNDYFAAQSLPWRAFVKKELILGKLFKIRTLYCFSDFAYLGSGGFSFISIYPKFFFPFIKMVDFILTKISKKLFAARMLIVLEKK